jgi:hypothetical protein
MEIHELAQLAGDARPRGCGQRNQRPLVLSNTDRLGKVTISCQQQRGVIYAALCEANEVESQSRVNAMASK